MINIKFWQIGDIENKPKWVIDYKEAFGFAIIKLEGGEKERGLVGNYISKSKYGFLVHGQKELERWLKERNERSNLNIRQPLS